jgi:hypothetical protein
MVNATRCINIIDNKICGGMLNKLDDKVECIRCCIIVFKNNNTQELW